MMHATQTNQPGELRSAVTLADFVHAWLRWRVWFFAGLALAMIGTFAWAKLFMTPFYRAEASFFVTQRFTAESRPGLAEAELYRGGLNEQFQSQSRAIMAEQYLRGGEFLLTVADRLQQEKGIDLARLLGIETDDPGLRQRLLAFNLSKLVVARKIEVSGVILLTVELPDPFAAAEFANASLGELSQRFTAYELDDFSASLAAYESAEQDMLQRRELLAQQMAAVRFDDSPQARSRRQALEASLQEQARGMGEMRVRLEYLRMATSPQAREAARPLTVISPASAPLHKSHPKTLLMTIMAGALYTFVFMVILTLAGLLEMAGQNTAAAAPAPSRPRREPVA